MTAPAFGPGKPQKDILEAWKEICVKSGSICKVGPEYYRGLANLSDRPLTNLLKLIVRDRADEINAWVFAELRMKSDEDLYDYLQIQVELFGRGYLCVNSDGSMGCCAPEGPEPTADESREIDLLTRRARRLVWQAVFNVLGKGGSGAPGETAR